jgi:hypothetical protein
MKIPAFDTIAKRNKWLHENKSFIIDAKKSAIKYADAVSLVSKIYDKENVVKAVENIDLESTDKIKVKAIINTTNVIDSHSDVHIKGLWNKSLKEAKGLYLLEQHKMDFDHVISDEVKAKVEDIDFKDLGLKTQGQSQALVFEAEIDKNESPKMFEKYAKGKVKNHSVGMRYVKLSLAINDNDYKEEKAVWDKYIDQIANKSEAEQLGYFYAVTEAKVIEGSAVLKGSNEYTPTQSIEAVSNDTSKTIEPSDDTRNTNQFIFNYLKQI